MPMMGEAENIREELGGEEERLRREKQGDVAKSHHPWRTMTRNCYLEGKAHLMEFLSGIVVPKLSSLCLCMWKLWQVMVGWVSHTTWAQRGLDQNYLEALVPRSSCRFVIR